MKLFVSIILVCFLFLSGSEPYKLRNYNEIKLHRHDGMLFLKTRLNGKPAKFLIDTGASHSLIDISQAEEYGFNYFDSGMFGRKYVGLGGLTEIYAVFNYELKGDFVTFLGADIEEVSNYFYESNRIRMVGIIGTEFLNKHGAIVDYKRNKLHLRRMDRDITID